MGVLRRRGRQEEEEPGCECQGQSGGPTTGSAGSVSLISKGEGMSREKSELFFKMTLTMAQHVLVSPSARRKSGCREREADHETGVGFFIPRR